ncbi:UNVERIFIED_CONTAM: U11/U12 small nuclear ribonucleoprotein [Sesamum angustifolium]|uniref:U11/U12 small nuclear ribonucleoprotein n=1 Tax=Sesamum angustifolium TaxID=2727405 RepID=A0AAW2LJ18_9LAMI
MVKVLPKTEKTDRPTKISTPFSLYRRSLTYRRLPEQLLRLSVLKLDGSSFSFHVPRNATVGRLKLAIEEEFGLTPMDEGKKLWPLVWSHFCLCYEGQKLISEKACIQSYGIKDGDQLHFIQHLRIDLAPTQQQCKNENIDSEQHSNFCISLLKIHCLFFIPCFDQTISVNLISIFLDGVMRMKMNESFRRNARDARVNLHVSIEDQHVGLKNFYCGEDLAFLGPKCTKLTRSVMDLLSFSRFRHSKREAWEGKNYG